MATQAQIDEFHEKLKSCDSNAVNAFIKTHPSDVDTRSGPDQETGLILASGEHASYFSDARKKIIASLINAGADPDARSSSGNSPLLSAANAIRPDAANSILAALKVKYVNDPTKLYDALTNTGSGQQTPAELFQNSGINHYNKIGDTLALEAFNITKAKKIAAGDKDFLIEAIGSGNYHLFKEIMDAGIIKVNDPLGPDGKTALHHAVAFDWHTVNQSGGVSSINRAKEMTEYLISLGADSDARTTTGETPFLAAARNSRVGSAEVIYTDLKAKYANNPTALLDALTNKGTGTSTPSELLGSSNDSNAFRLRNTLDTEIAKLIHDQKITSGDKQYLVDAIDSGNVKLMTEIINAGVIRVNTPLLPDGTTALHHAAAYSGNALSGIFTRSKEMTEFLLSKGADPDIRSLSNDTPLLKAIQNSHFNTTELLIDALVQKYSTNPSGLMNSLTNKGSGQETPAELLDKSGVNTAWNLSRKIKDIIAQIGTTSVGGRAVAGPHSARVLGTTVKPVIIPPSSATNKEIQRKEALDNPEQGF